MKYKILITLLVINFFSINIAYAYVTVGDGFDSDCDYSDLQSAIDSGDLEIRATNQAPYTGSYLVENQNITLKGGFNSCNDASQNNLVEGNKTIIQGNSTGHLLTINGGGLATDINITDFEIKNSMDGSALNLTGINGLVTIENTVLQNNTAIQGGGLYVNGANIEVVIKNSSISDNIANSKGGGIYCEGAIIKIDSTSLVSNNQVFGTQGSGAGGGMYARDCDIEIYSGHSDGVSAGFIGNQSTSDGAGIYAIYSQVFINGQQESAQNPILGDNSQPVLFKDNISDSDDDGSGYGAALLFLRSNAIIQGAWFDGNKGSSNGSGSYNSGSVFHAKRGSSVEITRDETQPCWRQGLCNLVTNNKHMAMVLSRSHSMTIKDTEFINNTVNATALVFINAFISSDTNTGTESSLTFTGNLVHNNISATVGLLKSNSRKVIIIVVV